ncbi:hypothetical protein NHF50_10215 [Flavobacterium sp. NRK F10]|uniref:hypothetical protein n=1 Tax=Flavobacterium sp. NRK F10 TaxID=2954931 RepID=UPI0020905D93|nr:hypothetical protein [Flavobacterium sp. NRK F10]MCO6175416.1 hypothetical protein [Flavobacterium sp. NRK F10]
MVTYDNLNFSINDNSIQTQNYAIIFASYNYQKSLHIEMKDREKNKYLSSSFTLQYDPNLTAICQIFMTKLVAHPRENRFSSPNAQPALSSYSFPYTMILTKIE